MTGSEFCLRLAEDCGLSVGAHVLAAVSGGADSTALLCFLCEARDKLGIELSCAHVEHGIRAEASLEDMAFVRALCTQLQVPFYASRVDAPALSRELGCGIEDAARRLRYDFLQKTAREIHADVIAVAHHRGDQAESVLLHAARGSDVRGLCAMRMRRGNIIRPLLDCSADELRKYLRAQGIAWREDGTNADLRYARNRIRHEVIPALEAVSPGAQRALARLACAAQRDEDYFAHVLEALNIQTLPLVNGVAVLRTQLESLHGALLSRVLVRVFDTAGIEPGMTAVEWMTKKLTSGCCEGAAMSVSGGAELRLGARYLCLTHADAAIADTPLLAQGRLDTPFGTFLIRDAEPGETGDGKRAQAMDERLLAGASVTTRREGDTLIPFGRKTPVKLKKLMTDAGVERAMRPSLPIVRHETGILWAVGLRASALCAAHGEGKRKIIEFDGQWPAIADDGLLS